MTDIPYNGVSTVNLLCNTATEILFQEGGQGNCRERDEFLVWFVDMIL